MRSSSLLLALTSALLAATQLTFATEKKTLASGQTLLPPTKVEVPADIPYYLFEQSDFVKMAPYTEEQLQKDLQAGRPTPRLRPIPMASVYLEAYYFGWQYSIGETIGVITEKRVKPWKRSVSFGLGTGWQFQGMERGYLDCKKRVVSLKKTMPEDTFQRMAKVCYIPSPSLLNALTPSYPPGKKGPVINNGGPQPYIPPKGQFKHGRY